MTLPRVGASAPSPADRDWQGTDYVRIYYSIITDEKFEKVYPDDRALAAWVRLLIAADAMYPTPCPVPAGVNKAALRTLIDAGIVTIVHGHYTLSGLAKERESRFGAGKGRPRYPSDGPPKSEPIRSAPGAHPESSRSESEPPVRAGRAGAETETETETETEGPRATDSGNGIDNDLWTKVQRLAEELTGRPHALANPYGGYGQQALSQATAVPWSTFEAGWRQVAAVYGQPTIRQLVFDGEDVLQPTGKAKPAPVSKADRETAEARAALKAAAGPPR